MEKNEIIVPELNNETIESMIYIIRGKRVMLDFELAKIYGYETKRFNEQVKNNINKFPERYRFQITNEELKEIARSKKSTAQIWATNKGGRTSLPYAFTEQGIYMLMTVLKGELATKQSLALVRAFK
ncbi:MAG: ORF6N domain-containing protein [Acholeplasmatales bacterium]|nr:ORF6N domain-containing protein [Acholeplasmatales bacterium]